MLFLCTAFGLMMAASTLHAGDAPTPCVIPMTVDVDSVAPMMPAPEAPCFNRGCPKRGPYTLLEWNDLKCANGNGANGADEGDEEEDDPFETIVTDRPDFTEASSTVGRGRIQLETGYTYFNDSDGGTRAQLHSFPEALWRIGMFADWFEFRIAYNFANERERTAAVSANRHGSEDLYLGCKIWLAQQKGWLPETALILQMTVPTGANAFSAKEVHPGFNLLYGWDVIEDLISVAGSTQMNRARPGEAVLLLPFEIDPILGATSNTHSYLELAQSGTIGYTLTEKLGAYTEFFALFPHSSTDPDVGPEYFFNGGFTYLVNNNLQLDIRAGKGLNRHAADFFAGTGFSYRY